MPTPAPDSPPTAKSPLSPRPPVLTLTDIGIRLGGRQILDQVSFSLAAGEFTGLIGSNGAGKTTLLRVVMGLRAPDTGTVTADGRALTRRTRRIGNVPHKR